jgi:hypothetical protein
MTRHFDRYDGTAACGANYRQMAVEYSWDGVRCEECHRAHDRKRVWYWIAELLESALEWVRNRL